MARKILGYALGRSLQDGDECTIQRLPLRSTKTAIKARTLIREIVLSTPFRNTQPGIAVSGPTAAPPKRPNRRLLGDK